MVLEAIQRKVIAGNYYISFNHTEKLRLRKIEAADIEEAILRGEIIEPYPHDPRGASYLILGMTNKGRPLHVLCGNLEEEEMVIITAYEPDSKDWESDWRTRKRGD
ncbi:MAG: DUF4258 domain-containing protein [Deltaproteobacteria bacterium]|nr:MAG: DUF4258 domain-containing protein [Deltaproteobacteria bacterium]